MRLVAPGTVAPGIAIVVDVSIPRDTTLYDGADQHSITKDPVNPKHLNPLGQLRFRGHLMQVAESSAIKLATEEER